MSEHWIANASPLILLCRADGSACLERVARQPRLPDDRPEGSLGKVIVKWNSNRHRAGGAPLLHHRMAPSLPDASEAVLR